MAKKKKTRKIAKRKPIKKKVVRRKVVRKKSAPRKTAKKRVTKKKVTARKIRRKTKARVSRPKKVRSTVFDQQINIKVFGVGGGGGNAISRMKESINLRSVDLVAVNTDVQDLNKCPVKKRVQIGKNLTRGLGAGMDPELGRQAADENRAELSEQMKGSDMVFITAGMGGGTGSGAAPVIAEVAKEHGALTIAIVTKPFGFEGPQRNRIADEALVRLRERVDALIVIPNDRIFDVIKKDTLIFKAFKRIDEVLRDAIIGVSELISSNGLVNVDFADIEAIMRDAGSALVGVGMAKGKNRAIAAATEAINSPLLEFSIEGAQGVLFGVSGTRDLKMSEVNEIAKTITATIDPTARIIFGAYYDRRLPKGTIKVTLIATGFNSTTPRVQTNEMFSVSPGLFNRQPEDDSTEAVEPPIAGQKSLLDTAEVEEKKKTKKEDKKTRAEREKSTKEESIKEDTEEEPNPKTDIWDIPAFLRKKRR